MAALQLGWTAWSYSSHSREAADPGNGGLPLNWLVNIVSPSRSGFSSATLAMRPLPMGAWPPYGREGCGDGLGAFVACWTPSLRAFPGLPASPAIGHVQANSAQQVIAQLVTCDGASATVESGRAGPAASPQAAAAASPGWRDQ
jgi:hypothetical protein